MENLTCHQCDKEGTRFIDIKLSLFEDAQMTFACEEHYIKPEKSPFVVISDKGVEHIDDYFKRDKHGK